MSQATISSGRRMSTARCYLDPIRHRPNLQIQTGALTEAAGRWTASVAPACAIPLADTMHEARAAREVVVSAGSINSPQLLELSGIGQPERLQRSRDRGAHALPGVGENLRDHYAPRTRWAIGAKGITFNDRGRGLGLVGQALRYASPARHARHGGGADPCLRPFAGRSGGAGPAAGLGADADRAWAERT